MKTWQTILSDGIQTLCNTDSDIERIFVPRMEEILSLLDRYIREIELYNLAYGLTGVKDSEELVIKHILDSLAPLGIIHRLLASVNNNEKTQNTSGLKIADAGSGAGLPGIPLAITLHDCHFTLIERMSRRAGFLWNTKALLGLSNIIVEEDELKKTAAGQFSLVTFRAFKPLEPKLLKTFINICSSTGIIAAYKGRREKIKQEILQLTNNKGKKTENFLYNCEIFPYKVPFLNEERNLLVIMT
ncbi:MAG: 16S rRNA (guanine(527)-N(7))-methyltransferase RsmG [Treponema sp.]|nr:16S rRNA (guanine(527)-N(7))-methyltransferase RsmG [Treponema sp.]